MDRDFEYDISWVALYLCPSASGGGDGFAVEKYTAGDNMNPTGPTPFSPTITFAHSHYVTNAGIHQPWGRTTPYCYDYDGDSFGNPNLVYPVMSETPPAIICCNSSRIAGTRSWVSESRPIRISWFSTGGPRIHVA